jgi:two-component system NtrC family sensor kinase
MSGSYLRLPARSGAGQLLCRVLAVMLLLALALTAGADASAPTALSNRVVITDDQGEYPLGPHLEILEDATHRLGIADVSSPRESSRFTPSTKDVPSFGFSTSAYWVRVSLERETRSESMWMLEFGYAPMQWIDVYLVEGQRVLQHAAGGLGVSIDKRPYAHHKHIFKLDIQRDRAVDLYVRVEGESSKSIPLRLYRADVFAQKSGIEITMLSIYAGIILALFLYNCFILITLRDISYLYYISFLASSLFCIASLFGLSQPLITPDNPAVGLRFIPVSVGLMGLFALQFTICFLSTKTTLPRFHVFLRILFFIAFVVSLIPAFAGYHVSIICAALLALVCPFALIACGILSVRQGNRSANYFLFAWFSLCFGALMQGLRAFGILPSTVLVEYSANIGSAAEAILLSVALAARMRTMKEDKERAQTAQLQAQKESLQNKQIALDTVQKYSVKLEEEVKIRTRELVETQQKLIASEKMAALGIFTAGMAHEINNPANFVSVSVQNASAQLAELRAFVKDLLADDPDPEIVQAFDTRFARLEKSTTTAIEGVGRIERVVKNLRANHPEGDVGVQPADVVATLESAWQVLSSSLKVPVTCVTDFKARPSVVCAVADLQQVFLALLGNAVHAIEDARREGHEGRIGLSSSVSGEQLVLTVEDNGAGIAPEVIDKIFDPFFTTKTVGRGAGLGLSMARDVINRHNGTIAVTSVVGEGAVFTLRLPLEHATENAGK